MTTDRPCRPASQPKLTAKALPGDSRRAKRATHWPAFARRPDAGTAVLAAPCGYSETGPDVFTRRFADAPEDVSCPWCRWYAEAIGGRVRIFQTAPDGSIVDLSTLVHEPLPATPKQPRGQLSLFADC